MYRPCMMGEGGTVILVLSPAWAMFGSSCEECCRPGRAMLCWGVGRCQLELQIWSLCTTSEGQHAGLPDPALPVMSLLLWSFFETS